MNTEIKTLTPVERRDLKARAHALSPVVLIGDKGLSPSVLAEVRLALKAHELIKIRVSAEREAREALLEDICLRSGAAPVQHIGKILVVYLENPDKLPPPPPPEPRANKARKAKKRPAPEKRPPHVREAKRRERPSYARDRDGNPVAGRPARPTTRRNSGAAAAPAERAPATRSARPGSRTASPRPESARPPRPRPPSRSAPARSGKK
jgi:RNA-binding protein